MSRWEHEDVIERAKARLSDMPEAMQLRRATAEHTYGSIKHWMGSAHFLTKTQEKISTGMSLHVLAYNMKRVINVVGTQKLIEVI